MRHGRKKRRQAVRNSIEPLERRVLLAVTAAEYAALRSTYPEFALPSDMAQINIIEITPDQLSLANLKSAITSAGNTTLPDLVVVRTTDASNTVNLASSSDEMAIDIPATNGALTIVSLGSQRVTLNVTSNYYRSVHVGSNNSTTTVNFGHVSFTGGSATQGSDILFSGGTLRLVDVTMTNNYTPGTAVYGGGIAVTGGNLTVRASSFNCSAQNGGILSQSAGTSSFTDTSFLGAGVVGYSGACMYLTGGSIKLNNVNLATPPEILLQGPTYGGCVFATHADVDIANSTIRGVANVGGYGGGIYADQSIVRLTNVRFMACYASWGAGIYQTSGNLTLTNVAFSDDQLQVTGFGTTAGSSFYLNGGTTTAVNVTAWESPQNGFYPGNRVYLGGPASLVLRNSIIAAPAGSQASDIGLSSYWTGTLSGANNLISDGSGQTYLVNGVNGNLVGTSASPLNPLLNIDSKGNMPPQSTSPAVNAGSNAWIPSGITTDLAGNPRIVGGTVDMGAYEYTAPMVVGFQVNDGSVQRSTVSKLLVTFSTPVTIATGAFSLLKRNGSAVPNVSLTVANPSGDKQTWQVTFSGSAITNGSLPDGTYKLLVSASGVADLNGNAMASNYIGRFYRLFGDSNGDRMVNRTDMVAMRNVLNMSASTAPWFDYDGSGTIDVSDWQQLKLRQRRALV